MNVCVIGGAGYVGLVTGLGLAELGHRVVNVDVDADRVARLNRGDSPIYEDGIEPLLRRNLDSGRIRFTEALSDGLVESEVVFIAVGTPSQDDGQADLSAVIQVAEELTSEWSLRRSATGGEPYSVVAVKSTVPVGAVELVRSILQREHREGIDFDIVSNPEFLREGKGLHDFFHPDRIVVGACSDRAFQTVRTLYGPLINPSSDAGSEPGDVLPVVEVSLTSAQLIKYASNAFLATRISFINEIAGLCDQIGADVSEVTEGMGYDARIGHDYLEAGAGFGGPCLEKDLRALVKIAEANGHEARLLKSVLERNEMQVPAVIAKLKQSLGNLLYRRTIAVFGLAFKAGTNDVRGSVALKVIDRLRKEGAVIRAHDPLAIAEAQRVMPDVQYLSDLYQTVERADALLILTEWPEFADVDYDRVLGLMASPVLVDAKNLLDPAHMAALGYRYSSMGRPSAVS